LDLGSEEQKNVDDLLVRKGHQWQLLDTHVQGTQQTGEKNDYNKSFYNTAVNEAPCMESIAGALSTDTPFTPAPTVRG